MIINKKFLLGSNSICICIGFFFILILVSTGMTQTKYDLFKQHEKLCKEIHETAKLYELRGRWDDAARLLEIGIELSQEKEGNRRWEAALKSRPGTILRLQRHFDEALPILLEAKQSPNLSVIKKSSAIVFFTSATSTITKKG